MTIRSRLLLLLLPALTALVVLIASFFYYNWSHEILNSFQTVLKSVVVATSQTIDREEIEWTKEHLHDPNIADDPQYSKYKLHLVKLVQQLPVDTLYILELNKNEKETQDSNEINYTQTVFIDSQISSKTIPPVLSEVALTESEEHQLFLTKNPFIKSISTSPKTGERVMTAYARVQQQKGDPILLLGADVNMIKIDHKLQKALLIIILGALATLCLVGFTVFMIANRISEPVQRLNQAALEIAAGNYDANIKVSGPKEIVELANTFNTMSECLVENITRLKESSLIRERMYGEHECSRLLQHYMLQNVIDQFESDYYKFKLTSIALSSNQKGILLKLDSTQEQNSLDLTLIEALNEGFEGMLELHQFSLLSLQQLSHYPYITASFSKDHSKMTFFANESFPAPLVWSIKQQSFIQPQNNSFSIDSEAFVFFYNSNLMNYFENEQQGKRWFTKILRHFSEEGLDTVHLMMHNELSFLAKKENLNQNFYIITVHCRPVV